MSVLQRLARRPTSATERCDLCSEPVADQHRHLLQLDARSVACVCQGCALLFAAPAASRGKYRLIPDRYLRLIDFRLTDAEWNRLQVPVGICFLMNGKAFYPGALGATEASLDPEMWRTLGVRYPVLGTLEPDVEALLVNRARGAHTYYIVPIDTCFSLVGLVRMRWRGLSGGAAVWSEIDAFFDALAKRARTHSMEKDACLSAIT